MHTNSETSYYHNDHLGTPLALSDEQGQVVAEWMRDPYGNVVSKSGTIEDNHMFPGQFWDADANLAYNWNRWYSPGTGRYVEADPIGEIGGTSAPSVLNKKIGRPDQPIDGIEPLNQMYAYVGSNPLRDIDPLGLFRLKGRCRVSDLGFDNIIDGSCKTCLRTIYFAEVCDCWLPDYEFPQSIGTWQIGGNCKYEFYRGSCSLIPGPING